MEHNYSAKGLAMRNKVVSATAKIFLEKGYEGTTSKMVARLLGVSYGSPFFQYGNKEGVLLELVRRMFTNQFATAEEMIEGTDPLLLCAAENSLQMHIAELSEPLRELYVRAYTLPRTAAYINERMNEKLMDIFGDYFADRDEETLRELELAAAGVARNFMERPCDEVFTMERKLRGYLAACFKIYDFAPERYEPVIEQVLRMDLRSIAQRIIDETLLKAEKEFETAMAVESGKKAQRDIPLVHPEDEPGSSK